MSIIACSFDGCEKPAKVKSLCNSHYAQMRRGIELKPLGRTALTVEQRFWQKVEKTSTCWIWVGSRTSAGYGNFYSGGKNVYAHRFSLELTGQVIAPGQVADHLCHNPECVNPSHLKVVSQKQNLENLSGSHRDSASGVRGVSRNKSGLGWRARVFHDGAEFDLGSFKSKDDAGEAARLKRIDLFSNNPLDRIGADHGCFKDS